MVSFARQPVPPVDSRPVTIPPVLQNKDYRNFWAGQTISAVGSQFTVVAMGWHMLELTDSALLVGLLGLCRAVPQMVLAVWETIWHYFDAHPEIKRRYQSDFEAYSGPDQVAIHIGVLTD